MSKVSKPMLGAFLGALALASIPNQAYSATELAITIWAGGYDKIFEEKILAEFLKQKNVTVRWILGGSIANVAKVKASRANPEIDIAIVDDLPQRTGLTDGLWEAYDPSIVTNLANLRDVARLPGDQGLGFTLSIAGLIYHRDVFKEKNLPLPTSWDDLFRKDLQKRVMLTPLTSGEGLFTLVHFARMNGGSEKNIEPGFAKMKELIPQVASFPQTVAIQATMFQRGEGWLAIEPLDYVAVAQQKGVPIEFAFPKEGAPARMYTASVVKNGPNKRLAQELINYLISERVQLSVAEELKTVPVNKLTKVAPEIAAMADKLYAVDMEVINAQRSAWIERWNKEIDKQ